MKTYFGYVRVSTVKQGDGVSLEAQKEAIQDFADRKDFLISEWFEEKETAAKSGRPVFNRMVKRLHAGEAQGLIVHKIDRSARNFADWAKVGELSDAGVDIHFATENFDFRSRGGRLTADIQAVIAADFIRNLRNETIKGINGRLKQGLYPFKAPIGYLNNGRGEPKTPDPLRAHHVRDAFRLYASGQFSLMSLLAEMQRRGFLGKKGTPVKKHVLENMLSNPFYCGVIRLKQSGATYHGIHEPLISVDLYEAVQRLKIGKSGKKVTRHNHLFRGLFRCALCDTSMIPERQKSYIYYRCHSRQCPTTCIREERLELAVRTVFARHRLRNVDIRHFVEQFRHALEARLQTTSASPKQAQLALVVERIDRLTDAYVDRLIDRDTFQERKERLEMERAQLTEESCDTDLAAVTPENVARFLERIKNLDSSYEIAVSTERRELVQYATSNRQVERRNVFVEPSDWIEEVYRAVSCRTGDPLQITSRKDVQGLVQEIAGGRLHYRDECHRC